MRSEWSILIIILFSAAALGGAYLVTQGGAFSKSKQEWRITISTKGAGAELPWAVEVPRLLSAANASREVDASLSSLLQDLHVEDGAAQLQLQAVTLRIVGTGNATLLASRTTPRGDETFLDWIDSGRGVSRLDDETGPTIVVTWAVDLSSGGGHACAAKAANVVEVPRSQTRVFPEPIVGGGTSDDEPQGDKPPAPLWVAVCA